MLRRLVVVLVIGPWPLAQTAALDPYNHGIGCHASIRLPQARFGMAREPGTDAPAVGEAGAASVG